MSPWRQLALPFQHTAHYKAAAFLADDSNAAARAWLERGAWPAGRLALWGGEGCGKTHLLHAWAERTGAALAPGAALYALPPRFGAAGLAIDDADTAPEEPLLHSLNAAAEAGVPVLLAARQPPARWGTRLPDLASRLRASGAVSVAPPGEAMLRGLLARLLAEHQMAVPQPLQDWLLLRLPRHPAALREAAARLDRAAMMAGHAVTRAMAEGVVEHFAEP